MPASFRTVAAWSHTRTAAHGGASFAETVATNDAVRAEVATNLGASGSAASPSIEQTHILFFEAGDEIEVLHWNRFGWWWGERVCKGERGWLPSSFLQPLVEEGAASPPAGACVECGISESRGDLEKPEINLSAQTVSGSTAAEAGTSGVTEADDIAVAHADTSASVGTSVIVPDAVHSQATADEVTADRIVNVTAAAPPATVPPFVPPLPERVLEEDDGKEEGEVSADESISACTGAAAEPWPPLPPGPPHVVFSEPPLRPPLPPTAPPPPADSVAATAAAIVTAAVAAHGGARVGGVSNAGVFISRSVPAVAEVFQSVRPVPGQAQHESITVEASNDEAEYDTELGFLRDGRVDRRGAAMDRSLRQMNNYFNYEAWAASKNRQSVSARQQTEIGSRPTGDGGHKRRRTCFGS
eukprot:TRINITY_DN70151_c0_g1_i1.p1 TRINITY_DN70151_c0_g1~~TRINITY_DN70151_c0_g1_i1.p1  ORF type:complete len:423 (+),score=87.20 TRINITY_DN70151_c0_g1_i1:29-1270(+)